MRPFPRITILATLALTLLAFPAQARHVHHQTQAYRPIIDVAAIPPYPLDQAQRHAYRPTEAVRGRIYRVRGTITITVQKRRQGASNRGMDGNGNVTYLPHLHTAHRSGPCDGIHRCRCGSTQASHFGLPRIFNGHNLWRAVEWKSAFPRTSAHVGVVMYQHGGGPSGHVSRIISYSGGCTATVSDDAGTYERNICSRGAVFLEVSGAAYSEFVPRRATRHHHTRIARQ